MISAESGAARRVPPDGGLDVVFIDLSRCVDALEAAERDVSRLSEDDHRRIAELAADPAWQRQWRATRIATRIMLERACGPDIRGRNFTIAPGGRPVLQGVPVHFSVSHSGDGALIAISLGGPVGVDIERLRPIRLSQERCSRIIAAAARLGGGEPAAEDEASAPDALRAWVRLEAAAKCTGLGIGQLLTAEGVIGSGRREAHLEDHRRLDVRELGVPEGYRAAIAALRLPERVVVHVVEESSEAFARWVTRSD